MCTKWLSAEPLPPSDREAREDVARASLGPGLEAVHIPRYPRGSHARTPIWRTLRKTIRSHCDHSSRTRWRLSALLSAESRRLTTANAHGAYSDPRAPNATWVADDNGSVKAFLATRRWKAVRPQQCKSSKVFSKYRQLHVHPRISCARGRSCPSRERLQQCR